MTPKKELTLFPDPEVKLYSCGSYPGKELEECKPYLDKSQKLVDMLGIKNIKELLVIGVNDLPFIKTFEEDSVLDKENDVRVKPYSYACTPLNGIEPSFSLPKNKEGLLYGIEDYITRNMDHKALAVVHPTLTDFIMMILKDNYKPQLHNMDA